MPNNTTYRAPRPAPPPTPYVGMEVFAPACRVGICVQTIRTLGTGLFSDQIEVEDRQGNRHWVPATDTDTNLANLYYRKRHHAHAP